MFDHSYAAFLPGGTAWKPEGFGLVPGIWPKCGQCKLLGIRVFFVEESWEDVLLENPTTFWKKV